MSAQQNLEDRQSGVVYSAHKSKSLIGDIRKYFSSAFPETIEFYVALGIQEYRGLVKSCQEKLNEHGYVRKIAGEIESDIKVCIDENRFFIQTNLYVRAIRPVTIQETETVGWHRESFYAPNMEKSFNVWTPVSGVHPENSLRYVPESQNISATNVVVEQTVDAVTTKGSVGNMVGFLYAPKKIIGGVDFSRSKSMDVPEFHSSIFPGELVHGSAENHIGEIRFSVDFRVLPFSAYDQYLNKGLHLASGKSYFEEF